MRKILQLIFFFLLLGAFPAVYGQITTPAIKANFGVDGDLQANYINMLRSTDNDDWFALPGYSGNGDFVIDTTGAAALNSLYDTDPASHRLSFMKRMRFPIYTVLNNKLLMDAAFVRDFHGNDSTVFASGSNKNGDNPAVWSCPPAQSIPDKNDILDLMMHVRRAGPTVQDSLWMFGGLSLDNITGNRYFDFEMYQTELSFNRSTLSFSGYGPDAGHTSWEFDAAGNVTKPGDIIFSAEYQSSSLTLIEARIWINKASLSLIPAAFDWSGKFDGASAGATFGYASIQPKINGIYFTGLQSGNVTWGGPFSIVLQNDAVVTDYQARQFVEFSVNLTRLGLDPASMNGGSGCTAPFRSLLVKTRSSSSFTAELKDFVQPFMMFSPAKADLRTATPYLCEKVNIAEIHVAEPVSTSTYQWSTTDGNIVSTPTGPSIYVDKPGTYIVKQYLIDGCAAYAADTIQLSAFPYCGVLSANAIYDFDASLSGRTLQLSWKVQNEAQASSFEIQGSSDGLSFTTLASFRKNGNAPNGYSFPLQLQQPLRAAAHYRIILHNSDGSVSLSRIVHIYPEVRAPGKEVNTYPNPVQDRLTITCFAANAGEASIEVYGAGGGRLYSARRWVKEGQNQIQVQLASIPAGLGVLVLHLGNEVMRQKILFAN